jgi:glutamate racemase
MAIAFFDSGVGGLTVLHEAMLQLPRESFIYYADTDNVPYGTKTHIEIRKYVLSAVDFLMSKEIKALVIACNTATSVVVKELRQKYTLPIIGMEPAVKPAVELSSGRKILVCATDRTLREDKLKHLIKDLNADDMVTLLSLQDLVSFGESFDFNSSKLMAYLDDKLSSIDWSSYHSIVLGCTHFIFYKNIIRKMLPDHVQIIDGNKGTVNRLISLIDIGVDASPVSSIACDYYISGREVNSIYFDHYMRFITELNIP